MWCWLNTNAGAIQGISAALTVVVTAVLAWITWRYVRLTNTLVASTQKQFQLTQKQFHAAYLPQLTLRVYNTGSELRRVVFQFSNVGTLPVRIHSLLVRIIDREPLFEHTASGVVGMVLFPSTSNTPEVGDFEIPTEVWNTLSSTRSIPEMCHCFYLDVVVSDVANLVRYRCSLHPEIGYVVTVLEP